LNTPQPHPTAGEYLSPPLGGVVQKQEGVDFTDTNLLFGYREDGWDAGKAQS